MVTYWKPPTDEERKQIAKRINFSTVRMNTENAINMMGLGHLRNHADLIEDPEEFGTVKSKKIEDDE